MDGKYIMFWVIPRAAWITYFILMLVWITHTQGGYHRIKTQLGSAGFLSYHYTFMTVAWPICMFEAVFSYSVPLYKMPNRSAHKYLHVALQTAAGVFIVCGLVFVGLFKHYSKEKQFWSLHSWLGAIAIAMYICQYTAGFWAYLVSKWSPERKAQFYLVHRFLGSATLLTAFAAILLGLESAQITNVVLKYSIFGLFGPTAYSLVSILIPIMGLMIVIQAVVIIASLVHGEQALPVDHAAPVMHGAGSDKAAVSA